MIHSRGFIVLCVALLVGVGIGSIMGYVIPVPVYESTVVSETPVAATSTGGVSVPVGVPSPTLPPPPPDAPVSNDTGVCTMDAMLCPDGSYVGRVAPGCAFAACPVATTTAATITCSPEENAATQCMQIYAPVCAQTQVECVTTPCDLVPQTYSNSCVACASDRVTAYTPGACEDAVIAL